MSKVILSRRRFSGISNKTSLPTFLRSLGIEYFRGRDFWADNAAILPHLREQMLEEARAVFHELHPDKGGDPAEFRVFLAALQNAKRQLQFHGVRPEAKPPDYNPRHQGNMNAAKFGAYKEKIARASEMLLAGRMASEVARTLRLSRTTVNKLKGQLLDLGHVRNGCACGRAAGHRGWCRARIARLAPERDFTNFISGGKATRFPRSNRPALERAA